MKVVFDDWRGENCPYGWTVERYTEYAHLHGEVRPDGYALVPEGNVHLPVLPELADLAASIRFRVNPKLTGGIFDLSLLLRTDGRRRRGSAVRLSQDKDTLRIAFGRQHGNLFEGLEERTFPGIDIPAGAMEVAVDLTGSVATVRFAGHTVRFDGVPAGSGRVGLCRGRFFGELLVERLEVTSEDDIAREEVLPWTTHGFPPEIGGMDVPIRYSVGVTRLGTIYQIEVELAGGAPEKTYVHPGNYHCRVIDWLTRPYVRFAGPNGETPNLTLAEETLVLCAKPVPNPFFYGHFYDEPEWPLKRVFRLEQFPADPLLVLGYEAYCCEAAQQRRRGPTEVMVEPVSKAVRHWGTVLTEADAAFRFTSSANQRLLDALSASDPRHALAAGYVHNNHFFDQGDACRFSLEIEHGCEIDPGELRVRCRLENALFEPMGEECEWPVTPLDAVLPKRRLARASGTIGCDLPVGVYHVRAGLEWGGRRVEQYCAFEVMPLSADAPIAPRASGLPVMFCMPNEITGLETDTFDPWHGIGDDVAHYTAICCFYPDFARTNRIWDVVRLYGRQWFVWITSRTTDRPNLEEHLDLVAECDFLNINDDPYSGETARWLARLDCYTGTVLETLRRFVAETGKTIFIPEGPRLDRDTFAQLLGECWHEWLAYYRDFYLNRLLKPVHERLRELNPRLKCARYGPYQAYAAHYKGTHHLNVFGFGDGAGGEEHLDGFTVFEDYPVACRYALGRSIYMLACCKLAMPRVAMYPEIYTRGVNGCPDGAVYYAWPPMGIFDFDDRMLRKRILETALATVWFDGGCFSYWRDHGFHVRNSTRERYEIILRAWQIVRRHPPKRPLRTTAFANSEACCQAYGSRLSPRDRVFNTTEEAPAWAYEMARLDGHPAGIVTRLEAIDALTAADIDTLVLPPLHDLTDEQLASIRRLHREGVSLLGFEKVTGLEDLFGVTAATPSRCGLRNIGVNTELAGNPLAELAELTEYTETVSDPLRYVSDGARVLLQGEGPVLFLHRSRWGKTALFNLPPTMVRRTQLPGRFGYGDESISELINRSGQLVLRELGSPDVVTTAGKLIAYRAENDDVVVIVEEDAFPSSPRPIAPRITIRLPRLAAERIVCDRDFAVVSCGPQEAVVRVSLEANDCAVITLRQNA